MDAEFWLQSWQDNRIRFHQASPTPWLLKYWPVLGLAHDRQVFVPLCGKSQDMAWLAAQGHRVLGVELSPLAVQQFFAEHGLQPETETTRYGIHHRAGNIEIVLGDVFALDPGALQGCAGVFDRAALIALPPAMRQRYVRGPYTQLPPDCRGLLVSIDYPQPEFAGPPHAVPEQEVHALLDPDWHVTMLDRREVPPDDPGHVGGVSQLHVAIYTLQKRTCP